METYGIYEKKKYELKDYLKSLDAKCKNYFGPNNKYIYPVANPYTTYTDVGEFRKKNLRGRTEKEYIQHGKVCKFINEASKDRDKKERYYKHINQEKECEIVKGHWDKNVLNRTNKYDMGMCWVTEADKTCGAAIAYTDSLRPHRARFNPAYEARKWEDAERCRALPGCAYEQQTAYTYDCVPIGPRVDKALVANPPEDMPLENFEAFLEEWYLRGQSPETAKLKGRGDRCNGIDDEGDAIVPGSMPEAPGEPEPFINYRALTLIEMKKHMNPVEYKLFSYHMKVNGKDSPYVQEFYDRMDKKQLEVDYAYIPKPVAAEKKFLPSIPQSVINMIMKNDASKNGNKRGMLAWHSTGSGKCHALDTPILMYDKSIKKVQDIIVGDLVMGDDCTPRRVLSLGRGSDTMYDIVPGDGTESYRVNSEHILVLRDAVGREYNIEVWNYLSAGFSWKGFRVPLQYTAEEKLAACLEFRFTNDLSRKLFLARSLGYRARIVDGKLFYTETNDLSYDIRIVSVGVGDYYGFTLDGNNRYLLGDFTVTHNTCTAAGVMDAFWDTDKQIIFASSIDAIASNPPFKFHQCCQNLFPRFKIGSVAEEFRRRKVRFLSFAKLSNRVANCIAYKKQHDLFGGAGRAPKPAKTHEEILAGENYVDLDRCVLIIDEVHNLFRPLPNQKKEHAALEAELIDPLKYPNMKIVILTATPGDNIPDIMKLLNIIRNGHDPVITAPNIERPDEITRFKRQIRGMISFFDMSGDDTKFPVVLNSAPIKYSMKPAQYEKYLEAWKTLKAVQKNYDALAKAGEVGKYYEPVRKYANMLFNFQKDMALSDFSSKLPHVFANFDRYPNEKHYLYSAFASRAGYGGHGVYAVANELEKRGYVKLTIAEARKYNRTKKLPEPGVRRYIIATNVDLSETGNAGDNLDQLLRIFNHAENKDGSLVHVMLAGNKYNESIDMKDLTNLHFLEPFVTMAGEKQAIGRSARHCAFANKVRKNGEWIVRIHRYMADKPIVIEEDKGPARALLQDAIDQIAAQIEEVGSKEELKAAALRIKEQEKEIAKAEKLAAKGKIDVDHIETLKTKLKTLREDHLEIETAAREGAKVLPELKAQLAAKKKELKDMDKPPKAVPGVENIEERIFAESRERFKQLFMVYQCMKDAAVDCRLLKDFHEDTGVEVSCAYGGGN